MPVTVFIRVGCVRCNALVMCSSISRKSHTFFGDCMAIPREIPSRGKQLLPRDYYYFTLGNWIPFGHGVIYVVMVVVVIVVSK